MSKYITKRHPNGTVSHIETSLSGASLLGEQKLNKGTAFSEEERLDFSLLGKLPERIETLDEQVDRAYAQFSEKVTAMAKFIYLSG